MDPTVLLPNGQTDRYSVLLPPSGPWKGAVNYITVYSMGFRKGAVDSTHKVLTYIEYRAVSASSELLTPNPLSTQASVSSPRTKGGGYTLAGRWGGWGSIFRKTPDIGLASYSKIPLRFYPMGRQIGFGLWSASVVANQYYCQILLTGGGLCHVLSLLYENNDEYIINVWIIPWTHSVEDRLCTY
jgi:hypothetical protein